MDKRTELGIMHNWHYVSSLWQFIIVIAVWVYIFFTTIWRATMKRPAIVLLLILAEVVACLTLAQQHPYILTAITALIFSILSAIFILWVRNRNKPG